MPGLTQIVIAGELEAADTLALTDVVRRRYLPAAVIVPVREAHRKELSRLLPWTLRPARPGRAGDGLRLLRLYVPGAGNVGGGADVAAE